MPACDILIFSVRFGNGHYSASQAIKQHLEKLEPSLKIKIEDFYDLTMPNTSNYIYDSYQILIHRASSVYNYFYRQKELNHDLMTGTTITRMVLPRLAKFIRQAKPKVIISTFPLCSHYVSRYKKLYHHGVPLVTCITDVVGNTEWIHPGTNLYLVASQLVKQELQERGIPAEAIMVTGIPVKSAFLTTNRDFNSLKPYGIEKEDFLLLLMGGGTGQLPVERDFYDWLANLNQVKTLIFTGNNHKLRSKLEQYDLGNNILVLPFSNKIATFMHRADLAITKAGGITIFEAIASATPFIIYNPQLGQELENSRFIRSCHLGPICYDIDSLKEKISLLLKHPEELEALRLGLHEAADKIDMIGMANAILALVKTESTRGSE